MLLSKGFFWTAIEVMTPWTPGGVLSVSKFRKFGKFQLLLSLNDFGLRPEERDHNHQDLSFQFKAARVLCILTPFSHKQ